MILFCILALIFIILAIALMLAISVGGAGAILLFGDVIVCMVLIVLLIRFLSKKRKKWK